LALVLVRHLLLVTWGLPALLLSLVAHIPDVSLVTWRSVVPILLLLMLRAPRFLLE
jgi:hypothetical protein